MVTWEGGMLRVSSMDIALPGADAGTPAIAPWVYDRALLALIYPAEFGIRTILVDRTGRIHKRGPLSPYPGGTPAYSITAIAVDERLPLVATHLIESDSVWEGGVIMRSVTADLGWREDGWWSLQEYPMGMPRSARRVHTAARSGVVAVHANGMWDSDRPGSRTLFQLGGSECY